MAIGKLKKGDLGGWRPGGGKAAGRATRNLTSPLKIKGRKAAVAEANPERLVRSAKRGKLSAHKVRISRALG